MDRPGKRGVTIRIYLIDGTADGMRLSDKSGWSGSCLDFSRSDYARARMRDEAGRTGIYVLVGPDPQSYDRSRVYVGEGDVIRTRLDHHQKEKEFWTRAFLFTTKDDSLNKAHIRYLEACLIDSASRARTSALENGTVPPAQGLSESERADMETYLDEVLTLLPLLGVPDFNAIGASPTEVPRAGGQPRRPDYLQDQSTMTVRDAQVGSKPDPLELAKADQCTAGELSRATPRHFHFVERGRSRDRVTVDAHGYEDPRGFVVFEGAIGPEENKVMSSGYAVARTRMREDGTLVATGQGALRLTRDYIFKSPSAAATVIAGSNRRGPAVWKDDVGGSLSQHWGSSAT
jgi:hypothetical protein